MYVNANKKMELCVETLKYCMYIYENMSLKLKMGKYKYLVETFFNVHTVWWFVLSTPVQLNV